MGDDSNETFGSKMSQPLNIVFIGNPNSGKTSLFNALSGLNQKVGNFPGVTVEAKIVNLQAEFGKQIKLIDLPGAYSLFPVSEDEKILNLCLCHTDHPYYPDIALYVADIRLLDKQLLLLTQINDLGIPMVICLTNIDHVDPENVEYWKNLLEKKFSSKVFPVSNRTGENQAEIKKWILRADLQSVENSRSVIINYDKERLQSIGLNISPNPNDNARCVFKSSQHIKSKTPFYSDFIRFQIQDTMERYQHIDGWIAESTSSTKNHTTKYKSLFTAKVDRILTHPVLGLVIFMGILFVVFQMIFSVAQWPMDAIDTLFAWMSNQLQSVLPDNGFSSLLTRGILPGLAGIVVFIPQIAILFLFLAILEEIGYMSRVVYLLDHLFSKIGLNGRSVIGLISGGACAIPAIMSTRSINSKRERLLTSFVIPLIPCSARLPVYAALIGFIVPRETVFGIFNQQGLAFMGLYLLGIFLALLTAYGLHLILPAKEKSILAMPLPFYQWPQWAQIWLTIRSKVSSFVLQAGKIIFLIAILLWFLASYSFPGQLEKAEEQAKIEALHRGLNGESADHFVESVILENSFAGKIGHLVEPLIRPLGFDWKIGIALITSFAAREVFVGTMSTIYSLGPNNEVNTLREKMATEKDKDGSVFYSPRRALSLAVFYAFAMQCMSTLAVMKRETNWNWAIGQFIYMGALAWISSFLVWNLF